MEVMFVKVKTAEEIAEVARLAAEIWNEYYVSLLTREQVDYMVEKYQSIPAITEQIEQRCEYYRIRSEEASVGYLAIKEEAGKLFLSKFYVHKKYRGRGCASRADAFLESLCLQRGLGTIWLTVNRDNAPSIAVYGKKGFRIVREQIADIGSGFVMDDFVMEKAIPVRA